LETEILKQIIESVTLFITPIVTLTIAYFMSKKLLKYKSNIDREISLLNDIIFGSLKTLLNFDSLGISCLYLHPHNIRSVLSL